MNTWVSLASGEETCAREGCDDPIAPGIRMVRVRVRTVETCFHAVCWLAVAEAMGTGPREGRRRLELTPEDMVIRLSILRKYAATKQRLALYQGRLAADPGSQTARLLVLRQLVTREKYRRDIAAVGGVPRSWEADDIPEELLQDAS